MKRGFLMRCKNRLSGVLRGNFLGLMQVSWKGEKRRTGRLGLKRVYPIKAIRVDFIIDKVYPAGSTLVLAWVDP
jgi:hypothetical protein